jgi:hypothetical protein
MIWLFLLKQLCELLNAKMIPMRSVMYQILAKSINFARILPHTICIITSLMLDCSDYVTDYVSDHVTPEATP